MTITVAATIVWQTFHSTSGSSTDRRKVRCWQGASMMNGAKRVRLGMAAIAMVAVVMLAGCGADDGECGDEG